MKSQFKSKHIITRDGLKIHYWVEWNKNIQGQWTVFHPGASMNHSSLQALEEKFNKKGHPTINFDPRGVGFSDKPLEKSYYNIENFSDDLARIINKEGIENPTLVGHSMGFPISVNYALEKNVEMIIGLCAPYDLINNSKNKLLARIFDNTVLKKTSGKIGQFITLADRFFKREDRKYPDYYNLEGKNDFAVWMEISDVNNVQNKAYQNSGKNIIRWNVIEQLQKLESPLILIYGTNDLMVQPKTGYEIASLTKSNCIIKTVKGTHTIPITQPSKVFEAIHNYI